eukprot:TRINITY_DN2450_c0_g1_i2.p1 TRINITY_DN2450_c0_g1~~TRINITY_DN2450_c0_g1_i2.p1  ORF type:complete len:170 (-),score=20.36 TRINITY_DN2450_c0_g1_i2:311-820(-)
MGVQRACLLAIGILVVNGNGLSNKLLACWKNMAAPAEAVCRAEGGGMRCSNECESEVKLLIGKLSSCCAEGPPEQKPRCEATAQQVEESLSTTYYRTCPSSVDEITAALMDVMPFGSFRNNAPIVAVASEKSVSTCVLAIGAAIAGATGASVAMVLASYIGRKQVLLPN